MIDRVIMELESLKKRLYNDKNILDGGIVGNALVLLKAQEPVEPILDIDEWKCGNCGHALEHQELLGDNVLFHEQYNYCPECGRMVKRG